MHHSWVPTRILPQKPQKADGSARIITAWLDNLTWLKIQVWAHLTPFVPVLLGDLQASSHLRAVPKIHLHTEAV